MVQVTSAGDINDGGRTGACALRGGSFLFADGKLFEAE
ncbi:hypothetical protein KPATCC21470_3088 [Kitasatospora purpeofusca]